MSFFLHLVKSSSAWKVKWFFLINLNWTAKKTVENVLHVVEKRNFTETISECPALDYFLMNWTTTGKCGTNGNWQIFNRIQNKKKLPVDIVWNTVWNWKPFFCHEKHICHYIYIMNIIDSNRSLSAPYPPASA